MSPTSPAPLRPRTAVLHQWVGMGDLVWHVPYLRRIAETSSEGKVSLIASPTTFARDLVGHEPWLHEVIDFDRHPRREEGRRGRHRGVAGLFRMGRELRAYGFERIILLTHHTNRSVVANVAGIPQRLGYGSSWLQRRLLSQGPFIRPYAGPAVKAYKDVTAFAIAQGWASEPIVPSLVVRPEALETARLRLIGLPRPLVALAIGASEPYKQWGAERFSALAASLAHAGCGVVLLGGPAERALAQEVRNTLDAALRPQVLAITDGSVAETVATLSLMHVCVGNDTGAANIAAAVGTPTWVVLGPRPPLEHDPQTLRGIVSPRLEDITAGDVVARMMSALRRAPAELKREPAVL
ncbi:glycosyltransferase family 9 protein [Roseateles sp. SL47]|uniref:glycosyltransferase family 9 protein n=1 Tax=Roseateles sp. SL47 TaxID=2995138 RepID=UPI00226E0965|nr:glycosyltransferase family 9 protein [Roseateles sp. SL47]WAC73490.1 glycosyltransferase family 9 protein [Roseateles sp. SL47]